ncbi:hypothetical protein [Leptolyngbya sp. 7M]|uniref:hypothetical protein n=1 Tax=Leptolyngbya sp. 7M TaxID=2812896 RepID=UPI001B8D3D1A|nr:hypothetical protein [Leptolyngbya sp. 7M]QYO66535.1 hypothetical protein JVX88_06965 [Leptolyngbya sp. 7M]
MGDLPKPKRPNKKGTEKLPIEERSYYYDDAHGYEDYEADYEGENLDDDIAYSNDESAC